MCNVFTQHTLYVNSFCINIIIGYLLNIASIGQLNVHTFNLLPITKSRAETVLKYSTISLGSFFSHPKVLAKLRAASLWFSLKAHKLNMHPLSIIALWNSPIIKQWKKNMLDILYD